MRKYLLTLLCLFAAYLQAMELNPLKRFEQFISTSDLEDQSPANELALLQAYYDVPEHERTEAFKIARAHGIDLTDVLGEQDPTATKKIDIDEERRRLGSIIHDVADIDTLVKIAAQRGIVSSYLEDLDRRRASKNPRLEGLSIEELKKLRERLL